MIEKFILRENKPNDLDLLSDSVSETTKEFILETNKLGSTFNKLQSKFGRSPTFEELENELVNYFSKGGEGYHRRRHEEILAGIKQDSSVLKEIHNQLSESGENAPEANRKKVEDFYDSSEFESLYRQAQALKGEGERVNSKDLGEVLKKGTDEQRELYDLLTGEFADLSKSLWEKSETRLRFKEAFESQEKKDITEFFKDLSDVPAEDQTDVKKLITAFEKKFPKYKGKVDSTWYQEQFSEQMGVLKVKEVQALQTFYNSDAFKKLYNQVSADLGQAPVWGDIKKALQAAGHTDILTYATKYEAESMNAWEAVWQKAKADFDAFEKQEFDKFTDDLTAKDFADLDALAKRFQATRKRFAGAKRLEWYKQQLDSKQRFLTMEWKAQVDNFYSSELAGIYAEVASSLDRAPEWQDIKAKIKDENLLYLLETKFKNESEAAWKKFWEAEREKFNSTESEALKSFADSLSVQDWQDLNAAVAKFQSANPNFSGSAKNDWQLGELQKLLPAQEAKWKETLNQFYQSDLPGIYAAVAAEKNGAPEWQDIRAKLQSRGDTDTLFILENVFKSESEAAWKTYWEAQKESFNSAENKAVVDFLPTLTPDELDNPSAAKARFAAETPYNAENEWFTQQLDAHIAREAERFNTEHQNLLSRLPDSVLATAMQDAFKNAKTFAERDQWYKENTEKVREYSALIEQNTRLESELSARVADQPDLKKKLASLRDKYAQGRTQYKHGFYSPRAYYADLLSLSESTDNREALVQSTIIKVENRTFNQIPPLTDKKKLTYNEFRDELKKLDFYALDPAVRKSEKVRSKIKQKNEALYQQWLDHRQLHIEKNKTKQVEQAVGIIKRVKLPAQMPEGIKDYESFTKALKAKAVYAALPKSILKNPDARKVAHERNLVMWKEYQAQQEQITSPDKEAEKTAAEVAPTTLEGAKAKIKNVTLTPELRTQLQAELGTKPANNPDTFASALQKVGVFKGVDASLWEQAELREIAWQQNMKLQQAYLSVGEDAVASEGKTEDSENAETNFGLPGHYKINWEKVDQTTTPEQKTKSIARFKQMLNRSELGLQTVMQHFHQPLGTFVLQTLAVMPQDRFDKALTALRDTKIEPNNRVDASRWLKALCENAGLDFLAKESASAWNELKQNYSTHFGTTLDKAWETEMPDADAEALATAEIPSEFSSETDTENDSDELTTDDAPAPSSDDEKVSDADTFDEALLDEERVDVDAEALIKPLEADEALLADADADADVDTETDTEATTEDLDEPLPETTDNAADDLAAPVEGVDDDTEATTVQTPETPLEFNDGDLSISDDVIDTVETDETEDETAELPSDESLDEVFEAETETDFETEIETDEVPAEALDDAEMLADALDDGTSVEAEGTLESETETTDETLTESSDAELDITTEDLIADAEATDETVDKAEEASEVEEPVEVTNDAMATATEERAEGEEETPETVLDTPVSVEEVKSETAEVAEFPTPSVDATEAEIGESDEAELAVEVRPSAEVIPFKVVEAKEVEADTQTALKEWQRFTETHLPAPAQQEREDLKKQFSEIIQSGLTEATIAKLKASGTWEKLMASPAHQQLLRTHLKQHQALSNEGLHFFTTLQQEVFFSSSMTVGRFLEQVKSYVFFTREIHALSATSNPMQDLSANQARALFNAFATRYHQVSTINGLSLSYENQTLRVGVKTPQGAELWHFGGHQEMAA